MVSIARMTVRADDIVENVRVGNPFAVELERLVFEGVVDEGDCTTGKDLAISYSNELGFLGSSSITRRERGKPCWAAQAMPLKSSDFLSFFPRILPRTGHVSSSLPLAPPPATIRTRAVAAVIFHTDTAPVIKAQAM
jgi:hypothetical protein